MLVNHDITEYDINSFTGETQTKKTTFFETIHNHLKIDALERDYKEIVDGFQNSMEQSIQSSENSMLPTFDSSCAKNNKITGNCAVVEIGGTNLRIAVVHISGDRKLKTVFKESWEIDNNRKHIDCSFFEWIVEKFISSIGTDTLKMIKDIYGVIKLGVGWSFPLIQAEGPNKGKISEFGKGFTISNEYRQKDLKDIFEKAFMKQSILIDVCSIVNDSISSFITGSFMDNSDIALVQGTGVNACFSMHCDLLSEFKRKKLNPRILNQNVVINNEASFLGHHLATYITLEEVERYPHWATIISGDAALPHMCSSMGVFQPLELLTSGKYLPVTIELLGAKYLNSSWFTKIKEKHLSSKLFAEIYQLENPIDLYEALYISGKGDTIATEEDFLKLKIIINRVIYRATLIFSAYIISLVKFRMKMKMKMNNFANSTREEYVNISVTGSIFRKFPEYKDAVISHIHERHGQHEIPRILFNYPQDSTIYGPAIAALVFSTP